MTHLFKLKILSGIALAITLTNTASANTIEKLSQNVKCQACTQTDLSGKPIYKNLQKQVFSGGNGDGYQGGNSEATSPRAALLSQTGITTYANRPGINGLTRDYDELHSNEFFLETINVPNAASINSGWLVFHLKSNGDSLDHNDAMYFGNYVDQANEGAAAQTSGNPADQSKYRTFSSRVNQFLTKTDNQGLIFQQDPNTGAYYASLDRLKLNSADHSGTTTLLEQIKQDGFMDMVVQDDTGIDYVAIIGCIEGKETKPRTLTQSRPRTFNRRGLKSQNR